MPRRNRAPSLRSGGFTLVELLLAVALLALLLAAVAFNFTSLQQGQALEQGASQFESLLRIARAHAALSGQNVLVALVPSTALTSPPNPSPQPQGNPDALALAVLAQPDPLRNPSLLVPISAATALLPTLADLVQLEVQRPQDPETPEHPTPPPTDTQDPSSSASAPAPPSTHAIQTLLTFRPDGSANAASFTLVSTDPTDTRRLHLSFDPFSATFHRRLVSNPATHEPTHEPADDDAPAQDQDTP